MEKVVNVKTTLSVRFITLQPLRLFFTTLLVSQCISILWNTQNLGRWLCSSSLWFCWYIHDWKCDAFKYSWPEGEKSCACYKIKREILLQSMWYVFNDLPDWYKLNCRILMMCKWLTKIGCIATRSNIFSTPNGLQRRRVINEAMILMDRPCCHL